MSLGLVRTVLEEDKQSGDVVVMAFHNGKLFTGAEGGRLVVYNPDLTVHKVLQAQFNTINDLCIFNNDLVTTGNDGLIKVWDATTLEAKKTLEGHENEVRVLQARDGKLFSGDMNGKVKIWSADYKLLFTLSCVEEVWSMAFANNIIYTARSNDVTCTEIGFKEMDVAGETKFVILDTFEGRGPLCIANDKILYCSREGTKILVKENRSGHKDVAQLEGHSKIINAMVVVDNMIYSSGYDGLVKMWDAGSFKQTATGTTVNNPVHSLAVGDDGAIFAGLGGGNIVQMRRQ
ncbi:F-box/WD repeat-containing protein 11-like [Pollicipes pollicipes]|uniref:F-box/WD repeat-containing protein 11-like n=1 Tax=Pollicipes pollicipes TaxID=41117 RepID=UPI0018849D14|nr:F-box/WD repeat-containing protein 11-like [Pollicipes pollicipes]